MSESARLRLLDQFKCLADKCPDDCCHQWNAHIDKATLQKWQEIKKQERRDLLLSTIQPSAQNPGEMVLMRKENGNCVHLDERGLCDIQRQFSHDYLPRACQLYPRDVGHKNTISFYTAHLSCPGIVQLLANNPIHNLIENEKVLYQPHNLDIISQLSCAIHKYMQNIFTIDEIYLGLKIYALSNVLAEIMQLALEDTLTSDLLNRKYRLSADDLAGQWIAWQQVSHNEEFEKAKSEIRIFLQQVETGLLSKYREQLEEKLGVKIPSLSLTRFYKWRAQVDIDRYEPFFEKYIRIKFLNSGFPWNPIQNNHTATYLECVIALLLCHHLIIAFDEAGIDVDEKTLQKITYTIEKINGHSYDIIRLIGQKPDLLNLNRYNLMFSLLV